jgi:hypothetical protein
MQVDRRSFIAGAIGIGVATVSPCEMQAKTTARKVDLPSTDWMIDPTSFHAKITREPDKKRIEMSNGLLRRTFITEPNVATIALENLMTGQNELRSIRPEAEVTINDFVLSIGGLHGVPVGNFFLPEWLDVMKSSPNDFHCTRIEEGKTIERFPWKRVPEWQTEELPWPPPGVALIFHYETGPQAPLKDVLIRVHYELYDGIPLIAKWIELENKGSAPIILNSFKAEILAIEETSVSKIGPDAPSDLLDRLLPIHVETDYAFGGNMAAAADNPAVHWKVDPHYGGRSYEHNQPSFLECAPLIGPELEIAPDEKWTSFCVFELLHDSSEMERRGLAMRKMMTTLAPWSRENPIFMHSRYADPDRVKSVIDQCAIVGFEMVILSFGSGFNIEDESADYLQQMKDLVDYAKQKKIAIGGYSLLASRGGKPQDLVIDVKTDQPGGARYGPSPCLCSQWGEEYFRKLHRFFPQTGMTVFENDGSYPGDYCASHTHPGHRGYLDSQWKQWIAMRDFYRWCRGQGIYLTVPDWYFLNGQSKTGMGYVETDWSVPREYQTLIERQDIYDGTWEKSPSMGWMHVPLRQYHGGGSAATVEPLEANLAHYETRLADLLGAGVQAAWRGDRLYDTDKTREAVKRWVDFYKQHRAILNSDIIHLRRADGQDWDGILHVNPVIPTRGLAMIYNPLNIAITREIKLPLYYTGLHTKALIRQENGPPKVYMLERDFTVALSVSIPAESRTWITVHAHE